MCLQKVLAAAVDTNELETTHLGTLKSNPRPPKVVRCLSGKVELQVLIISVLT